MKCNICNKNIKTDDRMDNGDFHKLNDKEVCSSCWIKDYQRLRQILDKGKNKEYN